MTRSEMLAIYREVTVAIRAVDVAQTAIHRALHAYSGCQLPSNAYRHLGTVYMWLKEEQDGLTKELTQEAS